jgi:hypothetical protein
VRGGGCSAGGRDRRGLYRGSAPGARPCLPSRWSANHCSASRTTNLPAETLEKVDGRWRLPRECGFTVVDELPPLAQLYRGLTLLEAYAYGPTEQVVEPENPPP